MESFRRRSYGFSLLELVIVLAVMTILAGVLVPIVKQVLDAAKVSKITALADTLANACRSYYKDTRLFATEMGSSAMLEDHQLAYDQTTAPVPVLGWNGPYIEGPLLDAVLPFEGAKIELRPTLHGAGTGYLLAGETGPRTESSYGQEIYIGPLRGSWAKKINDAFDGPNEGTMGDKVGRVVFSSAGGESVSVYIFVLDPFGVTK